MQSPMEVSFIFSKVFVNLVTINCRLSSYKLSLLSPFKVRWSRFKVQGSRNSFYLRLRSTTLAVSNSNVGLNRSRKFTPRSPSIRSLGGNSSTRASRSLTGNAPTFTSLNLITGAIITALPAIMTSCIRSGRRRSMPRRLATLDHLYTYPFIWIFIRYLLHCKYLAHCFTFFIQPSLLQKSQFVTLNLFQGLISHSLIEILKQVQNDISYVSGILQEPVCIDYIMLSVRLLYLF
ncbi:MAG: hypothetical protein DDT28_01039 [Dehalococcoidia bacterium]|nr:hypothetical protein [Chloroflexota bacterium]